MILRLVGSRGSLLLLFGVIGPTGGVDAYPSIITILTDNKELFLVQIYLPWQKSMASSFQKVDRRR